MKRIVFQKIFENAKKFISFSLVLTSLVFVSAENFRVRKLIPIELKQLDQKITVESGINDALFVTLPEDVTYVCGIELTFKIPEIIATWQDSVAYMLYDSLAPSPNQTELNYYGERVHLATFPGKLSLTVHVPITKDFSIKDNPYSVRIPLYQNFEKGIFLRFMVVMKGVPESLENSILEVTAKPVLKNQGSLNLALVLPQSDSQETGEKTYSVFIDDKPVQKSEFKNKILSTGEHHLSVVSDSYRNELRTFRIEQAKTTNLSVTLRGIEPLLKLSCPKDTKVFLDTNQIATSTEPIVVSQGEHTIKFILGDYEIVKTLSAENGRTYSVNLNVDASISEED